MSGILSSLWGTSPVAKAPQSVAKAKPEDNNGIYFRNEKGWPSFHIELLTNGALCDVANTECIKEAGLERKRAMTDAIEGTVLAIGIVAAALIVAKLSALFFVASLIQISMLNGSTFNPVVFFVTRVLTHTVTYSFAGIAMHKLWISIYGSIQDRWEAAKHLDDLGIKALLRKASFDNPATIAGVKTSSTDWE